MNINPFDLLKNAQSMQDQVSKMQEELKSISVTGSSGGNIVKITVNGQMEILDIEIDPIAVDPRDVKMLQDLLIAAHRDALSKIKDSLGSKFGPLLGSLGGLG